MRFSAPKVRGRDLAKIDRKSTSMANAETPHAIKMNARAEGGRREDASRPQVWKATITLNKQKKTHPQHFRLERMRQKTRKLFLVEAHSSGVRRGRGILREKSQLYETKQK